MVPGVLDGNIRWNAELAELRWQRKVVRLDRLSDLDTSSVLAIPNLTN
jgi:hypothetical protein